MSSVIWSQLVCENQLIYCKKMLLVCNNSAVPLTKTFIQIKGICFDHIIWLIYMFKKSAIFSNMASSMGVTDPKNEKPTNSPNEPPSDPIKPISSTIKISS